MAVNRQALGLTMLRILLGVFFLFQTIGKVAWLMDPGPLAKQLSGWQTAAGPLNRPYLDAVCLPWASVFARVVPLGELSTGVAFIFGAYTRLAAVLALLMVLNFHFASGAILHYGFLTSGYGFPVVGGLIALAMSGAALPLSLKK